MVQQTLRCKYCGWQIKGHSFWLKLWFQNPFHRCKSCKQRNFLLSKSDPDEVKVMRRNPITNELFHAPGETATKITRYQRDRHNLTKGDLEAGTGISEAKKRARSQKILEK